MGSEHRAYCQCGFKQDVTIGGSRASFLEESSFPYYCGHCGMVSVNVAKATRGVLIPCPNCQKPGCCEYGKPPVSIPIPVPKPPSFAARVTQVFVRIAARMGITLPPRHHQPPEVTPPPTDTNRKAFQRGRWEANVHDNLCPACKQMTLVFHPMPILMFD